jgi:single-strand DNA-binding protein
MPDTTITIAGNLTSDLKLRFTLTGAALASFTVAVTPSRQGRVRLARRRDLVLRCAAWRTLAEHVVVSPSPSGGGSRGEAASPPGWPASSSP